MIGAARGCYCCVAPMGLWFCKAVAFLVALCRPDGAVIVGLARGGIFCVGYWTRDFSSGAVVERAWRPWPLLKR